MSPVPVLVTVKLPLTVVSNPANETEDVWFGEFQTKLPKLWLMPVGGASVELTHPVTAIVELTSHVAVGIVPPSWACW